MKTFGSPIRTSVVLLACIAFLILPCAALLETPVISTYERQISMDLSPDFQVTKSVVNTNTSGVISQDITLTSSHQAEGIALEVMDYYNNIFSRMSPSSIIDLYSSSVISSLEQSGSNEIGTWYTSSSIGQNVTVHTIRYNNPNNNMNGSSFDFAFWNIAKDTYVWIISYGPKDITENVIKTLSIK
ncbi:MAG: hypothetical protein WB392_09020 [Methanotrichaceae archaeon]